MVIAAASSMLVILLFIVNPPFVFAFFYHTILSGAWTENSLYVITFKYRSIPEIPAE